LKLFIKIGGVEAFTDLKMAIHLNADGIVVPMVESEFALIKSQNMVEDLLGNTIEDFDIFINIETQTAVQNLEDICGRMKPYIKGITIGRSDLSYSYGFKGEQDSEFVSQKILEILDIAGNYELKITVGGGISKKTFNNQYLIEKIIPRLECIETRNVIFQAKAISNPDSLVYALDFEKRYLDYKLEKNQIFTKMDRSRFDTLMERG